MRRTCGFGRWLLPSAFVVLLMLPAGVGAGASTRGTFGVTQQPGQVFTCQSPECPITIDDYVSGPADRAATPYPSTICCVLFPDGPPAIDTIKVTLTGLTHGSLDNVDVLLVPQSGSGAPVELMSDVGGPFPAAALNLTFDDAASAFLPQGVPATTGTYRPTNYPGTLSPCVGDNPPISANADPFPSPAPSPPLGGYSQALSSFHGTFTPGIRLYVGDDCTGGSGVISSWSIDVTYIQCDRICLVKRADSVTASAGSPIGFTLEASNALLGPDTVDGVTLDDPLPAGNGVNWSISPAYSGPGSCSITGAVGSQRLSCNFGTFEPGAFATVHVSSATSVQSCGRYTNTGTLSGVVFDPGPPQEVRVQDTTAITVAGCATAVRISSFAALRSVRGVILRWHTASEAGTLGFNVYRQHRGTLSKLNRALIPHVPGGSSSGRAYRWLDRSAPQRWKLRYRLQTVALDGTRRWAGAALAGR